MKSIAKVAATANFNPVDHDPAEDLDGFEIRYIFTVGVSPHPELGVHKRFPGYPRLHTVVGFADDSILQITEDYLENIYTCVLDEGDGVMRNFAEVCGIADPVSTDWSWVRFHGSYGDVEWDCLDDKVIYQRQLDEGGNVLSRGTVIY